MEIMIVIALIMILSVVGIGSFTLATTKSRDTQRKNDLAQISRALESFYNEVGHYPLSEVATDVESNKNKIHCYNSAQVEPNILCAGNNLYSLIGGAETVYILLPKDPDQAKKYSYVSLDGNSYALYSALENSSDRDLILDGNGDVVNYDVSCGSAMCNYKLIETGVVKAL